MYLSMYVLYICCELRSTWIGFARIVSKSGSHFHVLALPARLREQWCEYYCVHVRVRALLVCQRWGVMPPIDEHVRLGDFVSPEQAFGLGEALHGLDPAEVRY